MHDFSLRRRGYTDSTRFVITVLSRRAAKRTCIIHRVHTPSTVIASACHRHTHTHTTEIECVARRSEMIVVLDERWRKMPRLRVTVSVCLSSSVTHAHSHANGGFVYIGKQVKQVAAKNCIALITLFGMFGRRTKPNISHHFSIEQPVHGHSKEAPRIRFGTPATMMVDQKFFDEESSEYGNQQCVGHADLHIELVCRHRLNSLHYSRLHMDS